MDCRAKPSTAAAIADMPLPTSPMDGLIGPTRDSLHARRYGLKTRERTNRLLMLMQLHANRQDYARAYATDIRAWLSQTLEYSR